MGQLLEEAQEARHKDCRRFRGNHSRKSSRENTMTDLIHMLLITSDPAITKHREKYFTSNRTSDISHLLKESLLAISSNWEADVSNASDNE